jgi:hypothetical protein
MRSLFASLRTSGAQGRSIRFSMFGRRESLNICGLEGALHIPMGRFRLAPTTFRRMNCWWSFAIMALAVR